MAKRRLNEWVGDKARLVNPAAVGDKDAYDRHLRQHRYRKADRNS